MDINLKVAIIAGSAALVGALIPTIFGYLNLVKQNNLEIQKNLLEKQKDIYWEYMLSLQNMINIQNNDNFSSLQKAVLKMSIYADNKTSLAVKSYWEEMIKAQQGTRNPLTKDEHSKFQKKLINSMRYNLNLEIFDSFEIIGFRPNGN